MSIVTIGLDFAKLVFQVHGVDAGGQAVIRKRLRRGEVAGEIPVRNGPDLVVFDRPTRSCWPYLIRSYVAAARSVPLNVISKRH